MADTSKVRAEHLRPGDRVIPLTQLRRWEGDPLVVSDVQRYDRLAGRTRITPWYLVTFTDGSTYPDMTTGVRLWVREDR